MLLINLNRHFCNGSLQLIDSELLSVVHLTASDLRILDRCALLSTHFTLDHRRVSDIASLTIFNSTPFGHQWHPHLLILALPIFASIPGLIPYKNSLHCIRSVRCDQTYAENSILYNKVWLLQLCCCDEINKQISIDRCRRSHYPNDGKEDKAT